MGQNAGNLLEGPIKALYRKYLFPSISATLVTSIYILADTMMIGRGVGPVGIAALNLLLPVFSLFFGTGMMFGVGGSVLFSISRGRKEEAMCRRYFTAALFLALSVGIIYGAGFLFFFDPVTKFLGRNESMDLFVRQYGKILIAGAPIFVCSSFFQAFVRNDSEPKRAMAAVITGGVSNFRLCVYFSSGSGHGGSRCGYGDRIPDYGSHSADALCLPSQHPETCQTLRLPGNESGGSQRGLQFPGGNDKRNRGFSV